MKLNSEYKQIHPVDFKDNRDALKGKVVDKIGFVNRGYADENIFAITFTDKTFIAIGAGVSEWEEFYKDEPALENFYTINPNQYHSLDKYVYLDNDGKPVIHQGSFVKVLTDLGIWDVTAEELQAWKEKHEKDEEEREYKNYLRLKEKFEGKVEFAHEMPKDILTGHKHVGDGVYHRMM